MVADFSLLNSSEILITPFCASRRRVSNKRVTCQNFKLKLNSPTSNSCRMIVYQIPGAAQFFHATLKNILVCCLDIQMRNRRNPTCLSNLVCSFSYLLVKVSLLYHHFVQEKLQGKRANCCSYKKQFFFWLADLVLVGVPWPLPQKSPRRC